jgi:CubicO group peptidase (beta-lactamase class C family)
MIFPRKEFEKASCKDANVEKGLIVDMFNKIDEDAWNLHAILLVKDGAKVFDTYAKGFGPDIPEETFSISKSFTSIAIGICQDLKLLKITDPILPFFQKELKGQPAEGYQHLKVEHLLMMAVGHDKDGIEEFKGGKNPYATFFGLPLAYEPGTHFFYDNLASYLLSAIVKKVSGQTVNDFLNVHLYPKLDMAKPQWEEVQGNSLGCAGLKMSAVDLAKFGLLLLNEGNWRGEQVVSKAYVQNATKYHISTSFVDNPRDRYGYGYQFWINDFEDYRAAGHYKQYILVNRQFNTVFVTQAYETREVLDLYSAYVLPALYKGWMSDNFTLRTYLQRFTDHSVKIIEAEKKARGQS